jgi:peptidoglycan/LPS O-acetylase OafA/YrhL
MRTDPTGAPALNASEAVPDAVAPPPGNPRFPLVDGVRAFAALTVIVFHVGLIIGALGGGGWHHWLAFLTFGPQMFFMFSGFLLYRPFLAARVRGTPRPSFGGYFRNRALRVIPAYWVFLTAFAIYPGLPGDVFGHAPIYYGMVHIYFNDTTVGGLNVSWTLCTELTFYFALPLAVMGLDAMARRVSARRAWQLELGIWVLVIALSWLYVQLIYGAGPLTPFRYGMSLALPGQAAFFAMGMILARLAVPLPGARPLREQIPVWPLVSWGLWALALGVYVLHMELRPGAATATLLNGIVGFLILFTAVFALPGDHGPERVFGLRFMKWLGLIAYGTYLAHYPIVHQLVDHDVGGRSLPGFVWISAIALGASVALGAVSYYAIERPALRLKAGRRRPTREKVATATT